MKFGAAVAVALALVALPSSGHASTNLVQNGDFAGCSGTTCPPWVFALNLPSASEFFLGQAIFSQANAATPDSLSQTITTTVGDSYTISFNLNIEEITTNQGFIADFGTSQLLNLMNNGTNGPQTFDVVASASSTTLKFLGYNVPANTILADVSVTQDPVATPLPAALPLFATGIAGLGLLGRRRKRKAQAVA